MYIYGDAGALARDTDRLDTVGAAPPNMTVSWIMPPSLVVANNLALILLTREDELRQRVRRAFKPTKLPQPRCRSQSGATCASVLRRHTLARLCAPTAAFGALAHHGVVGELAAGLLTLSANLGTNAAHAHVAGRASAQESRGGSADCTAIEEKADVICGGVFPAEFEAVWY
ncbi:MAG: hypothetical protein ABIW94_11370 [Gemmatimonadaceae bacterium]